MTSANRRRARLALLLALGGGALAVGLTIGFRGVIDERLRVALERTLSRAVHGEVRIASLSWSAARLRAEATGVTVRIPAPGAEALVGRAERVAVGALYRTLIGGWSGRVHLREVEIDAPVVSCERGFLDAFAARERRGAALNLRIDRLRVNRGRLVYGDRTIPLSVDAGEVEVSAAWDHAREALAGELQAQVSLAHRALREPLPIELRSAFRLGRSRLELIAGTARAKGVDLTLSGHLLFGGAPSTFSAEGDLSADLGEVAKLFADGAPLLAGTVAGPVRIDAGTGPWSASGDLRGEAVRVGPFGASAATSHAKYRNGKLELTDLWAKSLGGTVTGRVTSSLSERDHPFDLELSAQELDLARLVAVLGRALPVAGRAGGEIRLRGTPGNPSEWSGEGTLTSRGLPDPLSCAGEVAFTIGDARVVALSERLAWSGAEAAGSFRWELGSPRPTGRLEVRGSTQSAAVTRDGLARLAGALGIPLPAWFSEDVDGAGAFRADTSFGEAPSFDGDAQLRDGSLAGEAFDEASVVLLIRGAAVERAHLKARSGASSIDAEGRFRLEPFGVDRFRLDARSVDLARIARRYALGLELRGSGDLYLEASRGGDGLKGTGRLAAVNSVLAGEAVERLDGELELSGERLSARNLRLTGPAGSASGEATWSTTSRRAELRIGRADLSLPRIAALGRFRDELRGTAQVSGLLTLNGAEVEGELALRGSAWNVSGIDVGEVLGSVALHAGRIDVTLAPVDESSWSLEAEIDRSGPVALFDAALSATDVSSEFDMGPAAPRGFLAWSGFAKLRGRLDDPAAASGEGTLTAATVRLGNASLELTEPVPLQLESQALHGGPIHAQGRYSDVSSDVRINLGTKEIETFARGQLDLAILSSVWPDVRASGAADVDLRLSGPLAAPLWSGTLNVHNGRLRHAILGESLEEVELALTLSEGNARIDRASAVLGGGEVHALGQISVTGLRPGAFDGELRVAEVRLAYPEGFRGVYSGTLSAQGELERFLISGRLDLLRGAYTREFSEGFGSSATAEVPANGRGGPEIYLDVDLEAPDGVWLQNETARVEASVDLHVGGEFARPEVTGRIRALEGGTVHLRDAEYRIVSASLDFTDLNRIDPFVDVQAETRVQDYEISLRVQGTMEKFDYKLSSNPSLTTQDILSLLTTGQTLEEGQPVGSSSAKGSGLQTDLVAGYVAGALTADLERGLKNRLRLDRVRIDPFVVQGEADPTARVTIGKRVSKDLLLIYSADLGNTENQIYRAEWGATRKLKFSAERNLEGGVGGDLSYSVRLGERRAHKAAERAPGPDIDATPRPGADQLIRAVRLEGLAPAEVPSFIARTGLRVGAPVKRSATFEAEERIRAELVRRGYLEARVDGEALPSPGAVPGVELVFRIVRGPLVSVAINGLDGKERRRVEKRLRAFWLDNVSTEEVYDDARSLILADLRERGFYTAQVSQTVDRAPDAATQSVRFIVDLGGEVKVDRLRIEGNDALSSERILNALSEQDRGAFSARTLRPQALERDRSAIHSLYLNEGYLEASVAPPDVSLDLKGTRADVVFVVTEGRRSAVTTVTAPDPPGVPEGSVAEWAGIVPGQPFSYAALRAAEVRVRSKLDLLGFPESRVTGVALPADGSVAVEFRIDPGVRKVVGEIVFEGNRRTQAKVIRRELPFHTGDPLSREQFLETQQRLYRLGIFRNVRLDYAPESPESERQRVRVKVEEIPPLRLGVGAGYDTEAGLRGSVSISHDNLGGYDRSVSWQTFASEIYWRTQLLFQDPKLFNRKIPSILNISREHREQTGFTEDTWATAVRVEKRHAERRVSFLRYNFQQVNLSDVSSDLAVREKKLQNVRLGDLGYTWSYDGRNDPFLVREGALASLETRLFSSAFLSEESFLKVFMQGSYTHTFAHGSGLATAARLGIEVPFGGTAIVPISERFFAGGDSTVRGFARDELGPKTPDGVPAGGQAVLILNEEFRFPIYKSLRGVAFFDAGNTWSTSGRIDLGDLRPALGAGLRLETPIGPVRFEYGRKLDRREGESRGEFFVSIGLAF